MNRYMKLPKKKDNEKIRLETNDDLYVKRKGYHQVSTSIYLPPEVAGGAYIHGRCVFSPIWYFSESIYLSKL